MNKAVFLDRDGTLNIDYDHVFQVERIELIDGVSEAVGELRRQGFKVFIISNQSCIGRGYAKEEEVMACMKKVSDLMGQIDEDALIDESYFAPDHPDNPSERRKPSPGMILEAISKYNLDKASCWIIGDKLSDPMAGINAGFKAGNCVLLEPNGELGKTSKETIMKAKQSGFLFFKDLKSVLSIIVQDHTTED